MMRVQSFVYVSIGKKRRVANSHRVETHTRILLGSNDTLLEKYENWQKFVTREAATIVSSRRGRLRERDGERSASRVRRERAQSLVWLRAVWVALLRRESETDTSNENSLVTVAWISFSTDNEKK